MKIMMLITGMKSGGAERVMSILCNELSKSNEINLLILKDSESDYKLENRVNIVAGNIKDKSIVKSIKCVRNQILLNKPDIILSFMNKANIVALLATQKRKYKVPVVIAERANPYNTLKRIKIARMLLYGKASGCVFQTKEAQEYYRKVLRCKSKIIKNPLNPNFKAEFFEGEIKKKIVCTARLTKSKNQELLIKAFNEVQKKHPDYTLELYGEGPSKERLQQYINDLGIKDKVFFFFRKNDIQKHINDAEIFVLPSNSEGMPNALLEAMALGLACISTDCPIGGPAALIENEKNGILVPMNDVDKMTEAIIKIIENKDFADKLRENAKKVVIDYEATKGCKEWEEFLKECFNNYQSRSTK